MAQVKGFLHRPPYSGSSNPYSDYFDYVPSSRLIIKREIGETIELFFQRDNANEGAGVGLAFPVSTGVAIARALLIVSEGYATDIEVTI